MQASAASFAGDRDRRITEQRQRFRDGTRADWRDLFTIRRQEQRRFHDAPRNAGSRSATRHSATLSILTSWSGLDAPRSTSTASSNECSPCCCCVVRMCETASSGRSGPARSNGRHVKGAGIGLHGPACEQSG
jgi:hypothetical protein